MSVGCRVRDVGGVEGGDVGGVEGGDVSGVGMSVGMWVGGGWGCEWVRLHVTEPVPPPKCHDQSLGLTPVTGVDTSHRG